MTGVRAAFGFLTVVGFGATPGPDRQATAWFAPVGAAVGLVVGGAWWGAGEIWPALLAATVAVAVDAAVTGMLHLDGLADAADGMLPPLDRTRRLEVMADPRAGGFAVVTVALVLALRIGALASMDPDPLLLAGVWAAARAAMAVSMATMPYARAEGLASSFTGTSLIPGLLGVLGGLVLVVAALGVPAGPLTALALIGAVAAVVTLAQRELGGFTGDVLGAAGLVGETVALLVAAAEW